MNSGVKIFCKVNVPFLKGTARINAAHVKLL